MTRSTPFPLPNADYFSSDSDDGDAYSARADRAFALSEPGSSEGGFVIDLDDDDPSLERSIHALLLVSGNVGGLFVIIHVWKHASGCGCVRERGCGSWCWLFPVSCRLVLGAVADAFSSLCLLYKHFIHLRVPLLRQTVVPSGRIVVVVTARLSLVFCDDVTRARLPRAASHECARFAVVVMVVVLEPEWK